MKRKLNIGILALVAVFVLSGCNTASDQPDKVVAVAVETADHHLAIPEEDRYLFDGGTCKGDFPDNSEIKRIVLSKANNSNIWTVMYCVADLEAKTITYGIRDDSHLGEPQDYQMYELTDAEVDNYRNAFRSDLLEKEADMTKGLWKIAVEYKDGTFYAYQLGEEGYYNGSPENDMILAYFDKAEIPEKFRFFFSLHEKEV